ncbi:MAG: hypothetical protein NVSMB24_39140 [Mucilaginibacter sp.]
MKAKERLLGTLGNSIFKTGRKIKEFGKMLDEVGKYARIRNEYPITIQLIS